METNTVFFKASKNSGSERFDLKLVRFFKLYQFVKSHNMKFHRFEHLNIQLHGSPVSNLMLN